MTAGACAGQKRIWRRNARSPGAPLTIWSSGSGFAKQRSSPHERSDMRDQIPRISLRSSGLPFRKYPRWVAGGAPDEPLLAPGREIDWHERVMAAALYASEHG